MAKATRTKAINSLYKFIMGLKKKCDSINDVNQDLIMQYCRFTVMANELSQQIQSDLGSVDQVELEKTIDLYAKMSKIAINLYKTLHFDAIKDELQDQKNPYFELIMEAAKDGNS